MAARRTQLLFAAPGTRSRIYHFESVEQCLLRPAPRKAMQRTRVKPAIRTFTASTALSARAGYKGSGREVPMKGGKAQPSFALLQKKAQRDALQSGKVFEEFGMLPDTFVMQRMAERPGWLKDYRDRWLWEKARLKSRFTAFYQFMAVKYFMVRTEHPATVQAMGFLERLQYRLFSWYNFEMWSVTKIADRLYRDMYLALASGDIDSINNKLKKDISQSLKSRVLSRGKNTEAVWTLDKYHHRPRLVAYSVALIDPNKPKWAQSYMQQAVVELDTDQSLTRRKRTLEKQAETAGQNTARRVREYFVIQKSVIDGVGEDWKIWGMTRPTTIQDVRRDLNKQMGLSDDIY